MPRHRVLWAISLLLSLIFFLPNLSFSTPEQRLALLIGNSHYTHGGSLPNPVNDVRAMAKVLEGLGFTVLKYENCSQKSMKRAMDRFGRRLKGKDVGLFFYAGHGVQVNGHNYLLPVDAKLDGENDAEYDCVRAGRILAKMEAAGSRTNIVILDACRDNPFERSWRRGEKGSGLAFMNAPSGSLIAYSTAPGKTALDGGGRNSPYTSALLKNIETPNITVLQMFQRVRATVMRQSDKKQIPWESTSLRGDFYFKEGRSINVEDKVNEKPAIIETDKARLFVDTEPENAQVRILNINPRFYQGMELDPGHYHIEVSSNGYNKERMWSRLESNETKRLYIALYKTYISPGSLIDEKSGRSATSIVQFNLGILMLYQKKYKEAIQAYTKYIELNINDANGYYNRGGVYSLMSNYDKAIDNFTKTIELNPNYALAYYGRGESYMNKKQLGKAIKDLTKCVNLDPDNWAAYTYLCSIKASIDLPEDAIQDCNKAIALDPNLARNYSSRGLAYMTSGNTRRGCADFKKACELGDCGLWPEIKKTYNCY